MRGITRREVSELAAAAVVLIVGWSFVVLLWALLG